MLTLLFLLKFSVLWSIVGDHSILMHSFPFTHTIKCKIGVFKPNFLPTHNRTKEVVAFVPKDKKESKIKIMGGAHAPESVCSPFLYAKPAGGSRSSSPTCPEG